MLAACGGGGGGGSAGGGASGGVAGTSSVADEEIDTAAAYLSVDRTTQLFRPTVIPAAALGLDVGASGCSLASGALPSGMTLHADCSITGTPLQSGRFPVVVHRAGGDITTAVQVFGPSLSYTIPTGMAAGASCDFGPATMISWSPTAAEVVTYTIVEGALPPGLAINPSTGHLTGTLTSAGTYTFRIGIQVADAGRTFTTAEPFPESVIVTPTLILYNIRDAVAGVPFTMDVLSPNPYPGDMFSATALPPGLSIDAVTGRIFGTPGAVGNFTSRVVFSRATAGGGTFDTSSDLVLRIGSPVSIYWSNKLVTRGVPFASVPVIQRSSIDPLTGLSYAYAVDAASMLPTGLALNAVTGQISGTASTAGAVTVRINVTVTVNGMTLVVPVDVDLVIS